MVELNSKSSFQINKKYLSLEYRKRNSMEMSTGNNDFEDIMYRFISLLT